MIGYPQDPRAWGFTRGMARTLGVSLPGAVVDGWLSRTELGGLVERCQTCDHTPACTDWLARTVQAAALPGFCPNAPALTALKP